MGGGKQDAGASRKGDFGKQPQPDRENKRERGAFSFFSTIHYPPLPFKTMISLLQKQY